MANILDKFGKVVLEEIKKVFSEGANAVIPFTKEELKNICLTNNLAFEDVCSAIKKEFLNGLNYCHSWYDKFLYGCLACCSYEVMIAYECVANFNSAYNDQMCSELGVTPNELQSIYNSIVYYTLQDEWQIFQDYIWQGSKNLLRRERLNLIIPKPTFGPGRFVQYPKSQQVINIKTFKVYRKKFQGMNIYKEDSYSLSEFSNSIVKGNLSQGSNSSIINAELKEELAKRILFYCFSQHCEEKMRKDSSNNVLDIRIELDEENETFELYQGEKRLNSVSPEFLDKAFVHDSVYDDWILKKGKIDKNNDSLVGIVLNGAMCGRYRDKLNNSKEYKWLHSSGMIRYSFFYNPQEYLQLKASELFKDNAVVFFGGVRDQNSRSKWIRGLLPAIKVKGKSFVHIDTTRYELNNEILDLENLNLPNGLHLIKLPEQTPIDFEIVDVVTSITIPKGWYWKKNSLKFEFCNKDYILSGLSFSGDFKQSESKNRHWGNRKIEAINDKFDKFKHLEIKGE